MLTYSFSNKGELSMYEYLYRCIRSDIESGAIAPGEKLPSKRSFARHLGVSLITVEGAYSQLIAEGYLRAEPRRGYFACDLNSSGVVSGRKPSLLGVGSSSLGTTYPTDGDLLPEEGLAQAYASLAAAGRPREGRIDAGGQSATLASSSGGNGFNDEAVFADFTGSSVPLGMFPYAAWAKSLRDALTRESERMLVGETGFAGALRLRKAIADHLRGFRGMEVDPECIVVGAGSQVLYNWLVQLLGRNLHYGVEDPGYLRLSRIYEANNVELSHIPLDENGIDMASVVESSADVLHLMPSHQFPTGIVTSIGRRYELLGWASAKDNRYLVEDDYDCEFRLTGRPIPSLQSIDATGKVICANTFTKSLGPAFRIGNLVLPPELADRFRRELGFYSCTVSAIDQLALARFIESGDYERHVNRLRTYYRSVRDALVSAFQASSFSERVSIEEQDAGIHFIMGISIDAKMPEVRKSAPQGHATRYRFDDVATENVKDCCQPASPVAESRWEREFVDAAQGRGVRIVPLSLFYSKSAAPERGPVRRFLVSFGGIELDSVEPAVAALEHAVRIADEATR